MAEKTPRPALSSSPDGPAGTGEESGPSNPDLISTAAASPAGARGAEEALERRDAQFRALIENVNAGVALVDEAGRFLLYNRQFLRMFGLDPNSDVKNVNDRNWNEWEVLDEKGRLLDLDEHPVRKAALTRRAVRDELVGVKSPSATETVWMLVSAEPLLDAGGKMERLICTYTDMTERRRVEQAMAQGRAHLDAALASTTDAVFISDAEGRFVHFNDAFATFHRFPNNQACARTLAESREFLDVFLPDGTLAPLDQRAVPRALRGETATNAEYTLRRKDTGETWVGSYSFAPIRNGKGEIAGSVVVGRDVTPLKQAEAALRESEERLRMAQDAAGQGAWQLDLSDGRLTASARMLEILGLDSRESEPVRAPWDLILEEDRERVEQTIKAAEASPDGRYHIEYRIRRASDGAERWVLSEGRVCRDDHGRPVSRVGVARDITERKLQEQRLVKLSRLYAVLSKVNEAIVRCSNPLDLYQDVCRIVAEDGQRPLVWIGLVEGRSVKIVASCGPASGYLETLRVEIDGEYGQGPSGTSIREDRTVVNDDFDRNPATKPWRDAALRFNLRASASFPLHHRGAAIGSLTLYGNEPGTFDPEQVELLESLSANISYALDKIWQEKALQESERSLREVDQRKNEFLAVLSHELRNPLAPVRNSLFVLDHAEPGSEQARRAKAIIERQVGQMTRLVDDLLDVTRITRGKIRIQPKPCELAGLLRRTAEDHRSLLACAGVELEISTLDPTVWVNADAARIAQAVGNLLQNAAKFTGRGGRVTLSLRKDSAEGTAVVRVRDTGIGIAPDVLPRLFEPFVQADSSLDRSHGGLGLGLALVKGLAELHGGTVRAASEGLGKGSEFSLCLPLHHESSAAGTAPKRSFGAHPLRILVIEDNIDAAESLREVLRFGGHQVEVAHDGSQGIDKARAFIPEVVLCDIGLPGIDGYEVARTLRAEPGLAGARLIALSGYVQPEDLQRASEAGFAGHLAKPLSIESLYEMLGSGGAAG